MGLVPIKTSTGTGYCDCICGCYDLVSLRDEDTGKSYCAKEHLDLNRGLGLPQPPPSKVPVGDSSKSFKDIPEAADPPGRLH
jgi:hypothetical protein